jgi:hypothetical protein
VLTDEQVDRIITDLRIDMTIWPASDFPKILQDTWGLQYASAAPLREDTLRIIRLLLEEREISIIVGKAGDSKLWCESPVTILAELDKTSSLVLETSGTFVEKGWENVLITFGDLERA